MSPPMINFDIAKIAFPLAFLLGMSAGLGFAPLHWGILALAAYPCLYRLVFSPAADDVKDWRRGLRCAVMVYLFYVGNYAVSLFWIGEAPMHFSSSLWWMSLMAMVFVPILLALFTVPTSFAVGCLKANGNQYPRMLALALGLALAEYGRGTLFTGLTWNMPAHLLLGSAPLLQNVAWSGLYGGNLLLLVVLILPASLFYRGRHIYMGAVASLVLLVIASGYGWYRLNADNPTTEPHGIRIVQPNITGDARWQQDKVQDNFLHSLHLSQDKRPEWVQTVIWAEAVVPFDFTEDAAWRQVAAKAAPAGGVLIAGASRHDKTDGKFYNSMLGINSAAEKIIAYDKHHLVPFGEYVPLRDIVPLPAIAAEGNEYTAGAPPEVISAENLPPFIPLICYEIIFPRWRNGAFAHDNSARFILNLTNDEWYDPKLTGIPMGYYQHLQLARFAAVESGLPVVRAASSGISAVFDGRGRIIADIAYNTEGTLDTLLPPPEITPALRLGDRIFVALFAVLLLAWGAMILYIRNR